MITNRINSISKVSTFDNCTGKDVYEFTFFGDGLGDWEEISKEVSKVALKNYITHCLEQIKIANECLRGK